MPLFIRAFTFVAILAGAPLLSGQVTVTVTATANYTAFGYTASNPYTFIFTSGSSFASTANSTFSAHSQRYHEESTTEPQLWASITGSGVLGSYVRPAGDPEDPYSVLNVTDNNGGPRALQLEAGGGGVTLDIGNTTLDGTPIYHLHVYTDGGNMPNWVFPQMYVDPTVFFSSYNGTYSGFSGYDLFITNSYGADAMKFNVSSVAISTTAVPEPSTYPTTAACVALAMAIYRRRTATRSSHARA